MSFWKSLKELVFGAPLKQQFEELLQKEEVKETTYTSGNRTSEVSARKKVWDMIMKNSNNMTFLKKLAATADRIAGTKTPIVDMDDVHELVDNLTSERFARFYNAINTPNWQKPYRG